MLEIIPILLIACITAMFIITVGSIFYLTYIEKEVFLGVMVGLIAMLIFVLVLAVSSQVFKPDQSTKVTNESTKCIN